MNGPKKIETQDLTSFPIQVGFEFTDRVRTAEYASEMTALHSLAHLQTEVLDQDMNFLKGIEIPEELVGVDSTLADPFCPRYKNPAHTEFMVVPAHEDNKQSGVQFMYNRDHGAYSTTCAKQIEYVTLTFPEKDMK